MQTGNRAIFLTPILLVKNIQSKYIKIYAKIYAKNVLKYTKIYAYVLTGGDQHFSEMYQKKLVQIM